MTGNGAPAALRVVRWVAILNLAYFGVEFSVAAAIGSVSLFADAIDFLEDASINLLVLIGLRWAPRARARLGLVLAVILIAPTAATFWTGWTQWRTAAPPPAAAALSLTGAGALCVNLTCALLLSRHRRAAGSLLRAAFLSARNDVAGNVAILATALLTALTQSAWPDLVVGLGLAIFNVTAAREVFHAARQELRSAPLSGPR